MCYLAHSPHLSHDQTWDQSWLKPHRWLKIKLLFNNRDWYLDNLGSIIEINSILKNNFHSCLKFEPLYHFSSK